MKGNGVGQQGGSNILTIINKYPRLSFGVFGAIAVLGLALFAYGLSTTRSWARSVQVPQLMVPLFLG